MHVKQEGRRATPVLASLAGWWLALALLSYGLLSPVPPRLGAAVIPEGWSFVASKAVHVGAFASLAGAAALLPIGRRGRLAHLLTLAGYAALTEYLQTFVEGRYGCVQDVVINLTGVTLGVSLALAWRLRAAGRPPAGRELSATTTAT